MGGRISQTSLGNEYVGYAWCACNLSTSNIKPTAELIRLHRLLDETFAVTVKVHCTCQTVSHRTYRFSKHSRIA
ncbi:hypothetical protein niasHS_013990 [Heterodera schachtii]|uniref:Uncharacterized protein n=1 Tax=Heterodera schachtii TaxID=97005 RepID=A0ABD2IJZ2_HETSC